MYLVQRKESLAMDEVHVPRPLEGNPSALDEVHVPRPSGRLFQWTRYMYLVQAEGFPSNGRGRRSLPSHLPTEPPRRQIKVLRLGDGKGFAQKLSSVADEERGVIWQE
ncbi:hypothetical protein PGTUg99_010502 [Puccinia graminis f. sp. tritici]|uniref:Uncharacterized protein n=1 Tax=Puccinia graminis f. sp. tritici TaxID=56615 RepID=A0A5B0PNL0_PUCGR|nr:hypothetical protein PGTUg99_010502 [Puccinia graminis f. sp. tritici]